MTAPVTDTAVEEPPTSDPVRIPWEGVLAMLDTPTGDRRIIAKPTELRTAPFPMPIRWAEEDWGQHTSATVVGAIDKAWIDGNKLMGAGTFDGRNPKAIEIARQIEDGYHRWVSVDLDDNTEEIVEQPEGEFLRVSDWRLRAVTLVDISAFADAAIYLTTQREHALVASGQIPMPIVFDDAFISLIASSVVEEAETFTMLAGAPIADREHEWDGSAAASRVLEWATTDGEVDPAKLGQAFLWADPDGDPATEAAYKMPVADVIDGELTIVPAAVFAAAGAVDGARGGVDIPEDAVDGVKKEISGLYKRMADEWDDPTVVPPWNEPQKADDTGDDESMAEIVYGEYAATRTSTLIASSAPLAPPREWFRNPELSGPTPLTVTDDGRVYGHIARWDTAHIGFTGQKIYPPRSQRDYAYFHVGAIRTAENDILPVGSIFVGTAHAGQNLSPAEAMHHYSDSGSACMAVQVGEDAHGIWAAGTLTAEATEEKIAAVLRCPPSGDWRNIGGNLELVCALSVNTPGFPNPRPMMRVGEDNQIYSLVAAGALDAAAPLTEDRVREIAETVVKEWMDKQLEEADPGDALVEDDVEFSVEDPELVDVDRQQRLTRLKQRRAEQRIVELSQRVGSYV